MDHLIAEKNENNKDSQKGQVTLKKNILKKIWAQNMLLYFINRIVSNSTSAKNLKLHSQLSALCYIPVRSTKIYPRTVASRIEINPRG